MRSLPMAKSLVFFSALVLSLVAMVFLVSEPAMAQATTGRLTGTVVRHRGGKTVHHRPRWGLRYFRITTGQVHSYGRPNLRL